MSERMYSAAEAVAYLGVSHSRIRALCQQGRIKGTKVGQQWVITKSELDRFKKIPRHVGPPRQTVGALKRRRATAAA